MLIDRRMIAHFDWGLFFISLLLPTMGLVVLYSAGFDPDARVPQAFSWLPSWLHVPVMLKQMLFLSIGLVVLFFAMSIPTGMLVRFAYLMYGACIILLLMVCLMGTVVNGSRRWLSLGFFNLQPAEPMKFALILAFARYFSRRPPDRRGYTLKQLLVPGVMIFIPMAFIMAQPDLGSALVVGAIGGAMILFVGVRPKLIIFLASIAILGAYPAWHALHDYQQKRILTLINPEADPLGSGYHIIQSKIAVGSGTVFGKGFMKGTQTQLEFLPEHTTDFIFSVLGEEWGFVGCVSILVVYFILTYRLLRVVNKSKDLFQALLVFGVTTKILLHTIINIGMVVGIFPVVGIPLPLFSYGGSSVLSTMFGIGIALGVSMRRFAFSSK